MRFFKYLSLLFLLFSCQAHKLQKVNEKEGKVEIIIVNGTDFEKKIVFRKTDVIKKIKISPDYTTIYLHTKFCKEMNEIRYLGASFFEMKFYGSNNKLELVLGSFSKNAILSRGSPVPTLIFDEVDSGIGGATAAAVGERLARVADRVQVLVVTHSPQVAARGTRHFRVAKQVKGQRAETRVEILDKAERHEELARMWAGEKVTEAARAAARSLLGDSA